MGEENGSWQTDRLGASLIQVSEYVCQTLQTVGVESVLISQDDVFGRFARSLKVGQTVIYGA